MYIIYILYYTNFVPRDHENDKIQRRKKEYNTWNGKIKKYIHFATNSSFLPSDRFILSHFLSYTVAFLRAR